MRIKILVMVVAVASLTVGGRVAQGQAAMARGGTNFNFWDMPATDCEVREARHVSYRYHTNKSDIDASLAALYAQGQRRLRLMLWHWNSVNGVVAWVLRSDGGAFEPQIQANLVAFLAAVKETGFEEVVIAFAPVGTNQPWWWAEWREDVYQENWNLVYATTQLIKSVGIPYVIDLGNEMSPTNTHTVMKQYAAKLWNNFTYWEGTARTIGFSVNSSADAVSLAAALSEVYAWNRPVAFDVHFYGLLWAGLPDDYTLFMTVHNAFKARGWNQPWMIGETYYNDSAAADGYKRAMGRSGRRVKFLLQWPLSRANQCGNYGGDSGIPKWFDAYSGRGF